MKHGVLSDESWAKVSDIVRSLDEALGFGHPFVVVIGPHDDDTDGACSSSTATNMQDAVDIVSLLRDASEAASGAPGVTEEKISKPS